MKIFVRATWINLKNFMLSENSQTHNKTKNPTYCMYKSTYSKSEKANLHIQNLTLKTGLILRFVNYASIKFINKICIAALVVKGQ